MRNADSRLGDAEQSSPEGDDLAADNSGRDADDPVAARSAFSGTV